MTIKAYRAIVLAYFGNKCQKCGDTRKLQLHHIDGNAANVNVDNLTLLCISCHRKLHGRQITNPMNSKEVTCPFCNYSWIYRGGNPTIHCPKCHNLFGEQDPKTI